MTDPGAPSPQTLVRADEIGAEEGLRFIYAGNLPGQVGPWENTRCPACQETVIVRHGYLIRSYRVTADGCCPRCRATLPGIWPGDPGTVETGNDRAAYARRLPRAVQSLPLIDVRSDRIHAVPASPDRMNAVAPNRTELTREQVRALAAAAGS